MLIYLERFFHIYFGSSNFRVIADGRRNQFWRSIERLGRTAK